LKRQLVLIAPLLLAACDSGPEWRNQQARLANEANGIAPAAEESSNVLADTDYINETAPAGNDVNETAPAGNDVNETAPDGNQAEAPPEG
jgi:hypothetical protein